MTVIQSNDTLSGEYCLPKSSTAAATDQELASRGDRQEWLDEWDRFIDRYLVEWGKDPEGCVEAEYAPPSATAIDVACRLAQEFRDKGKAPPLRVLPDGEGGISFERREGKTVELLNVEADGGAELLCFEDCKLRSRQVLPPPA